MTTETRTHADWIDRTVYDSTGDKIGSVDNIYFDDLTGRPDWITVSTGWFGTKTQFIPIAGTSPDGKGDLVLAYTTDHVRDAPSIDADEHLDADDERRLYSHYGLDYDGDAAAFDAATADRTRADEGYKYADTRSDASVVRSEEELSVDKVQRESGRARLSKYVVTEDVNLTVPVRKEVARVVREPIEGTEAGVIDADGVEAEIVLTEETVVVDKKVVAKERVGIETETETHEETVEATLRKEEVDVDGDTTPNR